jgi:hypothetical protein
VRLPNGPDEMGKFATFNWIAADLKGRYFLTPWITVNGFIPLAVKKPDMMLDGTEPRMIGGMAARLEAKLPSVRNATEIGVTLSFAYLREGALGLSDKDFPLFHGDFQPGLVVGPIAKLRLSTLVDFSLTPTFVYQSATMGSLTAVQIPTTLILRLGSVVQASADLGIFTGDDYSLRGTNGGRISAGASLTVKLGPIIAHAGTGFASLLTGGLYPSVRDSVYIDLNVKYAK